jgi:hypothetical protein
MTDVVLRADHIHTPNRPHPAAVRVRDGRITNVLPRLPPRTREPGENLGVLA